MIIWTIEVFFYFMLNVWFEELLQIHPRQKKIDMIFPLLSTYTNDY